MTLLLSPSSSQLIVPLRKSDTKNPLFCIHPAGGQIGIYRKLIRLLPKQVAATGIQSRLATGETSEFSTIEEMAAHYVQLMLDQNPAGPIRLLGFSFGGWVATEIAWQLRELGRNVSFVGLIDTDVRWISNQLETRKSIFSQFVFLLMQRFREIGMLPEKSEPVMRNDARAIVDVFLHQDEPDPNQVIDEFRRRGYMGRDESETDALDRFVSNFFFHSQLLEGYQARCQQAPLYLWWPSLPSRTGFSHGHGWQKFAAAGFVENVLEGCHYSLMRMPTVRRLADQLCTSLNQATAHIEKNSY